MSQGNTYTLIHVFTMGGFPLLKKQLCVRVSEEEIAFVNSLTSPWFSSPQRFVISIQTANGLGGCVKPHCTQPNSI